MTMVKLGNAEALLNRRKFEAAWLGQADAMLPAAKAADHRELIEHLVQAAEQRDIVTTGTEETAAWIAEWLRGRLPPVVDVGDSAQLWKRSPHRRPCSQRPTRACTCVSPSWHGGSTGAPQTA